MGNTPSKTHHHYDPSHHPPSASKSRHQHPQYNPDNESSAQLGQASSEHLDGLGLGKWDTGTTDDTPVDASPTTTATAKHTDPSGHGLGEHKKVENSKKSVVKEVFTLRETIEVARASMEAVRDSPVIRAGSVREESESETYAPVNYWHCEHELTGIGAWANDIGTGKK